MNWLVLFFTTILTLFSSQGASANRLHLAIESKDSYKFLRAIVNADEKRINNQNEIFDYTPTHLAIVRGAFDMAQILFTHHQRDPGLLNSVNQTVNDAASASAAAGNDILNMAEVFAKTTLSTSEHATTPTTSADMVELDTMVTENNISAFLKLTAEPHIRDQISQTLDDKANTLLDRALVQRHFLILRALLHAAPWPMERYSPRERHVLTLASLPKPDLVDNAHLTMVIDNFGEWVRRTNHHPTTFLRDDNAAIRGLSGFLLYSDAFRETRTRLREIMIKPQSCVIEHQKIRDLAACEEAILAVLTDINEITSSWDNDPLSPLRRFFLSLRIILKRRFSDEVLIHQYTLSFFFLRFINPYLMTSPNAGVEKIALIRCLQRLISQNDIQESSIGTLSKFFKGKNKRGKKAAALLDEIYHNLRRR